MYKYLDRVNSPRDLDGLSHSELSELSSEIRDFLIKCSLQSGGHLASNLGVVELTLAIHRVFDSPRDRIIFDVGHQSYVHKILTGRREHFDTLRIPGGLSGFTLRRESEHDPFGAGHSSTALSAALGFAEADALNGDARHTVCVIGDGAYTGGMVHEALNNCKSDLPLIIILNENGMSISSNKGMFARYLSKVRMSSGYLRWKSGTSSFLKRIPLVGAPVHRALSFTKEKLKNLIYTKNYFEELGLYYMGTLDGHDIVRCEQALREARELGKTVVVHVKTQKGRGYAPAEKSPDGYHSVAGANSYDAFHTVASRELALIAEKNPDVVAVTAAMGMGTSLESFGEKFPDRYFDVGIAEEHALTFSAGLAAAGKIPFVGIYSTFLQRGYDSMLHDIALQGLPVKLLIDRAGLAVHDGATHHGIFDVSFLSHIPGVSIFAPLGYDSLSVAISEAITTDAPVAIRYPNAKASTAPARLPERLAGKVSISFKSTQTPDVLLITYGNITERAIAAADILNDGGINAGVAALEMLKPLDAPLDALLPFIKQAKRVVFIEEGARRGGVGEALAARLMELSVFVEYKLLAIDDSFVSPSEICDIYEFVGLDEKSIVRAAGGAI
ncbi:MAG: 1-deoxy-D-xylulose-5-phosphate synthase [Clostridia bacterium]|nr:1-deoxy-D-xylulose-5-phosphate synthase [Clostridia bacterium]